MVLALLLVGVGTVRPVNIVVPETKSYRRPPAITEVIEALPGETPKFYIVYFEEWGHLAGGLMSLSDYDDCGKTVTLKFSNVADAEEAALLNFATHPKRHNYRVVGVSEIRPVM